MEFFSKIGETISDAGKDVSRKAKEFHGIARLNMDIRAKEDFIKNQYIEIGKKYYEIHKGEKEPFFEEISLIDEAKKDIFRMEQDLADLKGMRKCPDCGQPLDQEAKFCSRCGKQFESFYEEV